MFHATTLPFLPSTFISLLLLLLLAFGSLTSAGTPEERNCCLHCSHQQVTSLGAPNAKMLQHLVNLTRPSPACVTLIGYEHDADVACSLEQQAVCEFHLVTVELAKGNEMYSVQALNRGCLNRYTDLKQCFHTGLGDVGDYGDWARGRQAELNAIGFVYRNLTSERCYCNDASDCNGKVVALPAGAGSTAVGGMWRALAGLAVAIALFRITG